MPVSYHGGEWRYSAISIGRSWKSGGSKLWHSPRLAVQPRLERPRPAHQPVSDPKPATPGGASIPSSVPPPSAAVAGQRVHVPSCSESRRASASSRNESSSRRRRCESRLHPHHPIIRCPRSLTSQHLQALLLRHNIHMSGVFDDGHDFVRLDHLLAASRRPPPRAARPSSSLPRP